MLEKPVFLQGLFEVVGYGLTLPGSLNPGLHYKVPLDRRAQLVYFRAGNPSSELIYVLLLRNGKPMRYFPVGAKASTHIELAVVEDLEPDTELEVLMAAPKDFKVSVVLDIGLVEIQA
jgi:hypothetical protein